MEALVMDVDRRELTIRLTDKRRKAPKRLRFDLALAGYGHQPEVVEQEHPFFEVKHQENSKTLFKWKQENKLKDYQARVFGSGKN